MKKTVAALSLLALPLIAAEGEDDLATATFERYEIILERMPFGDPPPGFNPDAPPATSAAKAGLTKEEEQNRAKLEQQQQQLVQQLKVTMLNVTPAGDIAVGFNAGDQHYYLLAGQEKDGWKVVGADLGTNEATFQKDDVEVTVKLGGQAGAASARAKTPVPVSAAQVVDSSGSAGDGGQSPVARLRQRRKLHQEQMDNDRKAAEEAAKKAAEELKAEREAAAAREAQAADERQQLLQQMQEIVDERRREREEAKAKAEQDKERQAESRQNGETE